MDTLETLPTHIFREYDIRGVVGEDLTPKVAYTIGRAFAAYLVEEGSPRCVVVGRDNRASSLEMSRAVIEGLTSSGFEVVDVGTVITPAFYFARVHYGMDGGVMVTASHNPPEYNGMKLAHGFATLYGEDIRQILRLAENGRFPSGHGHVEQRDIVPIYRGMLREKIRLGPHRLKVAIDCGSGTASLIAPEVIEDWGCTVLRQHCDSDPTFPYHEPNPVRVENVQDLVELVRRESCDVGIGFDGDGDRLGVIDDQGQIVWGDTLMILYWREILPKYPGTPAIIEVKCSQSLWEEVERLGGNPFFYRTGHSLIKAKMREVGAVFTGEMSGHMFFADEYFGFDDAVYATGRLLRILSSSPQRLSEILATVARYAITPEIQVEAADEEKFNVVRDVREEFRRSGYQVIDVDGVRVIFPEGWGLIRASNTQPALILRAEAKDESALDQIKGILNQALAVFPQVARPDW